MTPRSRAFFALVAVISAAAAGCSGGGSAPPAGSGGAPTPTPTPVSTGPTPIATATAVPAATAAPTGPAISVSARPLATGDVFNYAGTTTQQFVYTGATPHPTVTIVYTVAQTVTVSNGKTYGGVPNLTDFATAETDTSTRQTTTVTTHTYYALTAGPNGRQALTTYGWTSNDSNGQTLGVTFANPGYNVNGTVDILPEARDSWSNTQAQTILESESDGFSATRVYAADGTYTDRATIPQSSNASPSPTPLVATIAENADGSGTYNLPLLGPPNLIVTYSTPAPDGGIAIAITDPSQGNAVLQSARVGAWFQTPLSLYSEIDRDNGGVTFPGACNVPGAYGTSGNQVEQKFVRTDTILGTLEFFDQLAYVAPNAGVVCVQLSDVTYVYYDYSGQGNGAPTGVSYSGGNAPLETDTLTTTLGLTSATLNGIARRPEASTNAFGFALGGARARFSALLEERRLERRRALERHFRGVARGMGRL